MVTKPGDLFIACCATCSDGQLRVGLRGDDGGLVLAFVQGPVREKKRCKSITLCHWILDEGARLSICHILQLLDRNSQLSRKNDSVASPAFGAREQVLLTELSFSRLYLLYGHMLTPGIRPYARCQHLSGEHNQRAPPRKQTAPAKTRHVRTTTRIHALFVRIGDTS